MFILTPYLLGNLLNKMNEKRAKYDPCVVIAGANAIFVLILRYYMSDDLLKIK